MCDLWNERYDMNFFEQRICDQRNEQYQHEQYQQLCGSWLSQIEIGTIEDEINHLEDLVNQEE